MAISTPEYRQVAVVMALVRKTTSIGGGVHLGVSIILQGVDTGGPPVWIGVLDNVGRNEEDSGDHPYGVPTTDHW